MFPLFLNKIKHGFESSGPGEYFVSTKYFLTNAPKYTKIHLKNTKFLILKDFKDIDVRLAFYARLNIRQTCSRYFSIKISMVLESSGPGE